MGWYGYFINKFVNLLTTYINIEEKKERERINREWYMWIRFYRMNGECKR